MKHSLFYLSCANEEEADRISALLLDKKLVVCVKRFPVISSYRWKGKVEHTKEVLLIMDSYEELFKDVEQEIKKVHRYETFVLVSTPVKNLSQGLPEWFTAELKSP